MGSARCAARSSESACSSSIRLVIMLIGPANSLITEGTNAAMTSRRSRVWSGGSVKTRLDFTKVDMSASRSDDPSAECPAGGGMVEESLGSPNAHRMSS